MACAIQLKRMGLDPLVIEKNRTGGMLFNANLVENYPGFPGGIPGPDLVDRMTRQFESYDIPVLQDEVKLAGYSAGQFSLSTTSGLCTCNVLVIASGSAPKIPEECSSELIEKGLVRFDISDLREVSGKSVGIIGAGDAAFDYSLTLAENNNNVFIFNRGNHIKALKALSEKVFINKRIHYLPNIELKSLDINDNMGLDVICNSASSNRKYSLDYLIFATGRKPADGFFRESLEGLLPGLLKEQRLYLIGDVINGNYRQVSVAVGDGVRAAMEIFRNESNQ
jgi:thioredoxin reductase